jgi:hypothetical protein
LKGWSWLVFLFLLFSFGIWVFFLSLAKLQWGLVVVVDNNNNNKKWLKITMLGFYILKKSKI